MDCNTRSLPYNGIEGVWRKRRVTVTDYISLQQSTPFCTSLTIIPSPFCVPDPETFTPLCMPALYRSMLFDLATSKYIATTDSTPNLCPKLIGNTRSTKRLKTHGTSSSQPQMRSTTPSKHKSSSRATLTYP